MTGGGHDCEVESGAETNLPDSFRLEYLAFRQLHYDTYVDYAQVRTRSRVRAVRCVENVFDRLCASWHDVLRGSPASRAWELLSEQAGCLSDCSMGHSWPIHCLLEDRQADAVLLHQRLCLSVEEAANLMGVPDYTVRSLLRTADRALRALPSCVAPLCADVLYGHGAQGVEAAQ